jgi:eukaryotic-like serine/threonine-protein kinase
MREIAVGDRLDQYEIQELIARSGMASIFRARDTATGQTVALKVPHMQFESDVVFFERFQREEEIGQRLDHSNVIKFLKPRHKSRMYVAMEFVEGRSLRALMEQERPLPRERALAIAQQIGEALVHMHERGVVHRDLKPENALLTTAGQVKIVDFGIALDKSARRLTWVGLSNTVGTPDYIAPEQIGGRRGDARSDVYALGTILYEMLTGNLPFSGPNALAVMRAKAEDEPRLPSYFVPGFDPHLEAIILRAIEHDPRDRYQTAAEMLRDLKNPAAVPPRDPHTGARRRRGLLPRRFVMPLVIVAILAGLAALIAVTGRKAPPRAPPQLPRER